MLNQIKEQFEDQIIHISNLNEIDMLRVKFIGKNGLITELMKNIRDMEPEERKAYGAHVNTLKEYVLNKIEFKKNELEQSELRRKINSESIDISQPTRLRNYGAIHPLTNAINEVRTIFEAFGFNYVDGPEIEDEWFNFTALNTPSHHPARQMHDTFYIKEKPGMLLRTQTSNVQIRSMSNNKPPFKNFTIGKTFRSDSDSTHSPMFHQLEVMYVDKHINIGHLKYCLEQFLQKFFQVEKAPIRMRASHFPFTEPSAEVDVMCDRSNKGQIIIGKGNDWIEILGSGMIHPNVLKNCGIDPDEYQGFAFGVGIERLAMLKYNISDVRKFYDGDIRWLNHYGF